MKTYILIFTLGLVLVLISCKSNNTIENKTTISKYTDDFLKNKYNIIKIDSIENVYLIYAKKGDSIIKIASKKENTICVDKIKKGHSYSLNIKSVFNETFHQRRNIAGVNFNGTNIRLKEEGVLWDLFISDNIKGLCIINK